MKSDTSDRPPAKRTRAECLCTTFIGNCAKVITLYFTHKKISTGDATLSKMKDSPNICNYLFTGVQCCGCKKLTNFLPVKKLMADDLVSFEIKTVPHSTVTSIENGALPETFGFSFTEMISFERNRTRRQDFQFYKGFVTRKKQSENSVYFIIRQDSRSRFSIGDEDSNRESSPSRTNGAPRPVRYAGVREDRRSPRVSPFMATYGFEQPYIHWIPDMVSADYNK
jgi:hypothetical protein